MLQSCKLNRESCTIFVRNQSSSSQQSDQNRDDKLDDGLIIDFVMRKKHQNSLCAEMVSWCPSFLICECSSAISCKLFDDIFVHQAGTQGYTIIFEYRN
jgi:hypothetical protein